MKVHNNIFDRALEKVFVIAWAIWTYRNNVILKLGT